MRFLMIATLASVSIAGVALAQQSQPRSPREMMNEMRATHGQNFDQCQALATSRGYRLNDDEYDRGVVMFIEGCIMGRQR
jgi:hypothetical protein